MRLTPLMLGSILIFAGCSAGAGMQATPPAPIAQSADSTAYPPSSRTTGDATAEDVTEAAQPPVTEPVTDGTAPTGAGGRFLLL